MNYLLSLLAAYLVSKGVKFTSAITFYAQLSLEQFPAKSAMVGLPGVKGESSNIFVSKSIMRQENWGKLSR